MIRKRHNQGPVGFFDSTMRSIFSSRVSFQKVFSLTLALLVLFTSPVSAAYDPRAKDNYSLDAAGLGTVDVIYVENSGNVGIGVDYTPDAALEIIASNGAAFMISNGAAADGDMFVVQQNGDVGIGIANPAAKLHVNGGLAVEGSLSFSGTTITNASDLIVDGGNTKGESIEIGTTDNYELNLITNGNVYATLDNNGNLGIGITDPSYLLDVNGTAQFAGAVSFNSAVAVSSTLQHLGDADTMIEFETDVITLESGGNTDQLVLSSDGRVGIGTDAPGAKLQVNGNAIITGILTVNGTEIGNGGSFIFAGGNNDSAPVTLGSNDNYPVNIETNGSTALTVASNGDVGVGIETPGAKLHVNGDLLVDGALSFNGTSVANAADILLDGGNSKGDSIEVGTADDYNVSLVANGNTFVTLDNGGNFGIGTTDPGYLLDVNGTANFASTANFESDLVIASTIQHAGDADTSIQFGTDTITLESAGYSDQLALSSDGRVGIRTSTPSAELEVNGSAVITGSLTLNGTEIGNGAQLIFDGGNTKGASIVIGTNDAFDLSFETNNSRKMTIASNGDVGIGTTTPSRLLQVTGSEVSFSAPTDSGIVYENNGNASITILTNTDDIAALNFSDSGVMGRVEYDHSSNKMQLYTNSSPQVAIDANGSVGIGDLSPDAMLDVNGAAVFGSGGSIEIANGDTARIVIDGTDATPVDGTNEILENDGDIFFRTGDSLVFAIDTDSSSGTDSVQFNANGGTNLMTLSDNGNVGVGITTPTSRFQVHKAGSIKSELAITSQSTGYTNGDGLILSMNSIDAYIRNYEAGSLNFGSSGSVDMTIIANGDVGIGTTSPGAELEVAGDVIIGRTLTLNGTKLYNGADLVLDGGNTLGEDLDLGTLDNNNINLLTNNTNRATIRSNGDVGIGTMNPAALLDVNGTMALKGSLTWNGITIDNGADLILDGGNTSGKAVSIGTTDANSLSFITSGATELFIATNGDVGVGTTNPAAPLDVNGNTAITGTLNVTSLISSENGFDAGDKNISNVADITLDTITADDSSISVVLGETPGDDFIVDTSTLVVESDTNRVGIGTLSPTADLDVAGTINGLTVTIGTMTLSSGSIEDSSGSISFNGLNLSTNGSVTANGMSISSLDLNEGNIVNVGDIALDSISADDTNISIAAANGSVAFDIGGAAGNDFSINGELFVVEGDSGQVGIGISDPSAALDINGDIMIRAGSPQNGYVLASTDSNGLATWMDPRDLSEFTDGGDARGTDRSLGNTDDYALSLITNGTELVYLAANGDVGIKTSNPSTDFEVNGASLFTGDFTVSADAYFAEYLRHAGDSDTSIRFTDDAISLSAGSENFISIIEDGSQDIIELGDDGDIDIKLSAGADGALFVEGSTGRVGIGTLTPTAELDVAGTINGLTLNANGLIISSGSITDNGGTIDFDDENLVTTGYINGSDFTSTGDITVGGDLILGTMTLNGTGITDSDGVVDFGDDDIVTTGEINGSSLIAGTTTISSGSITDSNGTISFGDEQLITTGDINGDSINATTAFTVETMTINGGDITDTSGAISFGTANLSTSGILTAGSAVFAGIDNSGADIEDVGDISLDTISANGTTIGISASDTITVTPGTDFVVALGGDAGDDFIVDSDTLVVQSDTDRVGIGTTAPTANLDVNGDVVISGTLTLNGTTINNGNDLVSIGGNAVSSAMAIGSTTDFDVELIRNGNAALTVTDNGNIAIGVSTAPELLTVNGVMALAEGTAPSNTAGYGKIYVKSADSSLYFQDKDGNETKLAAAGPGSPNAIEDGGNAENADVTIGTNDDYALHMETNNSIAMSIDNNGSVGIGITTPGYLLHVNGSVGIESSISLIGSSANIILGNNYISGDGDDEGLFIASNGDVTIGGSSPKAEFTVEADTSINGTIALAPNSSLSVSAGTSITVTNGIMRVVGSGGAVDITANPQIAAGNNDGQIVIIKGLSDTNTVRFDDGAGLELNSGLSFTLGRRDTLVLMYDAVDGVWIEVSRSDN